MVIYVTVDADRAIKTLTQWTRRIPKAGRRGTYLMANRFARAIRDEAKLKGHNVTGYLSSKKGTAPVKIDKDTWGIKMPYYTPMLEQGTRPHFIPRTWKTVMAQRKYRSNNPMLSFAMFRAIISGQGTRPHPFVAGAIMKELKKGPREVEKQIKNVIRAG